jgi:hypothetical protein
MGSCLSCCGESEENRSAEQSPTQEESNLMDEYPFPVKYSLGQSYPRTPDTRPAPIPNSIPHTGNDLLKIVVPWHSPVPLTAEKLHQKREEFWETAPAFGGAPEVWQALRNAVDVGHQDMDTARAILSCVGVTTPTGYLTEAYDERGYRYSIPSYCLAEPENGLLSTKDQTSEATLDIVPLPEDLPKRSLKLRVSTGDDLNLQVPSHQDFCLGHLREIVRGEINTEKRIEFFWSGHGPLSLATKLSALENRENSTRALLQAWIFADCK